MKIAGGKFEGRKEEAREFQARIEAERKTQREILEKHLEEVRIVKKESNLHHFCESLQSLADI